MDERTVALVGIGIATLAIALLALGSPAADVTDTAASLDDPEAVRIVDGESGSTLATVPVTVAETPAERRTGLSEHESLESGTGMWFVFDREARRTFTMRGMDFSIDMLFVGSDGRITRIHHANASASMASYRGSARWVLEVAYGFANDHGIQVGDRVTPVRATAR